MGKDSGSNPIQINCEIRVNSLNVPCLKFLVISVRVLCWGGGVEVRGWQWVFPSVILYLAF